MTALIAQADEAIAQLRTTLKERQDMHNRWVAENQKLHERFEEIKARLVSVSQKEGVK